MASYPTVDLALADLRDPELFARVATVVLSEELPGIVPTGRSGDLGRDAYVREAVVGEETIAIQFSLESDWQGKVRRELERHERDPTLPPQLLFVTNREPTEAKVRDLRSFAQERYGVTLTIRGREWLAAQLERWQLRDVAERLLGVRPDRPRRVVPAARYRERLAAHTAGFGAELVGAQDSIAEIADALRASRVVLVTGEGGVGKTRLALTAAGEEASVVASGQSFDDATALELLSRPPGPVVIDDAHRADALHAVRVVLDDPRFADVRLLVTVRTGTERAVTDAAGVSPGEAATVRLGRLPRAAIDRLVAAPPHPVSVHALRLRIVRLAEGRPLAAHLACEAAHRGDLRTAAGELDVWTGYLERLLDVRWPSFYGDVLAVCAAIGGIDPTADGDLAALRAALPGRADDELLAALDSLADHGALFELGGRLAVKPDRLAAFVVWNRLLAPAPRRHLTWQRATDGLPSPRRHRLLPVLVEAVAMGDGTGGELILTQLRQSQWPPPEGDTGTWYAVLFDAKDVAHSIPRRVSTLLDVFVNTYPQPAGSLNPSGLPIAPEETLRCACEAAGALIGVDDVAAMRHLLDLLRLAPDGSDAEETGRKLIDSLLCEPEGDWRGDAHARRARLLEAIGRWAESAHGPVSVRVAAYAAGQAIAVTFTAMSRTAEDNMRFRFSAWAVDRDPVHARLVLGAAALLGTIVPRLDEAGLMLVLDRMAELDRIAAGGEHAGPVGPGTHAGAWGRRLLRTSTSLVASVFAGQWARLPHRVRRRVALMQPAHPLVASAAAADVELQRVTQSLTATGDADHEGFAAVLERDGLEAAAGVVAAIAADETIDAAAVPLAQALATAISSDTARAIARALTPAALQAFLPAALAAHPALGDLVDGFVARPETSAAVAAALDALEPDAERATLRALAAAGDVTACVRHLKQCARLDRAGRAAAALQLAVDARSGDCARTVLAAWDDHDALTDPATLNDALQLGLTDCREVATELTPAIARLGELDPGAWADVVLGWLQRMLDTEGLQPPEPFRQVRSRLAPPAALVLVERAAAWAQQRLDAPRWRHVESVVDTLITAPGATEARDAAILRFATGPQSHVTFAARMVAHCCDDDVWFAALGPLLRAPLTPTDRRLLNDSMLRGLPSEGSQAEHLETRGETLARRPPPADPIVAAFLRDAVDRLRETAQTVRERERRDSEGYD